MKAHISASFLGTETAASADGTKTFYRVGIVQGMNAKVFTVSADLYAAIIAKGFVANAPVIAEVEIIEGREKTFVKLLDIIAAEDL